MKVIYKGTDDVQIRWGSNDDPRGILVEGKVYEVLTIETHTWHTKYILKKYPNLKFNSVCLRKTNEKEQIAEEKLMNELNSELQMHGVD